MQGERLVLWLPALAGAGIAVYFALPVEPAGWLAPTLLCGVGLAVAWTRRWMVFCALLPAVGFAEAALHGELVAAPVLVQATGVIRVEGRVAEVESVENGQRLVLDQLRLPDLGDGQRPPERLRLHLKAEIDARPGWRVSLPAVLMPPPPPAAPGAFDFPRQAWFKGLGAVGYAAGPLRVVERAASESRLERGRLWLAALRRGLTLRIQAAVDDPGVGAVAAALVTGERGPVAPSLLQAYRDAGLAHILVIAGMHLSMVAGLAFVALRAGLAMVPWLALRIDIKKVTAAAALAISIAYLAISGAPVPTQRAFMMNAIVLVAVLADRQAVSLRSITWAALAILALEPEALVGASFQLSFAAVYGLIAGYEALGPLVSRRRWGLLSYGLGILLTTLLAGAATAFYTIFHFNRFACYGLLGNLLAVPVVGFWVMPSAMLAICLLPFGLDGWGWQAMGHGIALVNRVALWVSSLPGASVDLPAMPVTALVVFTLGGLWLCLWPGGWRLCGLAGMAAGAAFYAAERPPDILVDGSARLMAVRGDDGRLWLSQTRSLKPVREAWTRQAGQGTEAPQWRSAGDLVCGAMACRLVRHERTAVLARFPEAVAQDCADADLVVVAGPRPAACAGRDQVIDADDLKRRGTHAIWLERKGLRIETVADWQGRRPWSVSSGAAAPPDAPAP